MLRTMTFAVATLALSTLVSAQVGEESEAKVPANATMPMPPLPPLPPEGGLTWFSEIGGHEHSHQGSCVPAADRERLFEGIREYIQRHGPFDAPGPRGASLSYPVFPVGAREWQDLVMSNYVDLDPSEGGIQDWNCTGYTYDGHKGADALIGTFDHQLIGVPVTAVLDGTVVWTQDGFPDQNTVWIPDAQANGVGIHHGGDLYTFYYHFRNGSVSVEVGQPVRAGEQIGLVGSSGYSDWPHLHLESWYFTGNPPDDWGDAEDWTNIEPYTGGCNAGLSGWESQVGIPVGATCRDFGITTSDLQLYFDAGVHQWRPPLEGSITLDHDKLWMWTQATDIGALSTYRIEFYDPSGNLNHDSGTQWLNFSWNSYRFGTWGFWWDLPGLHTIPGTWTVNVIVNDNPYINFPLEVLEPGTILPNRPPEPVVASISPSDATPDDVLTCRVYTLDVNEPDWDLVRYRYTWSVGGRILRNTISAGLADHLPRLEGCDGAVVECQVIPSDGVLNGPTAIAKVRLSGESSGDSNCDGNVDIVDLLVILNEWGSCSICSGDHNQDGEVDITDLLIVIGGWG
jgi:murein DD-endopeptidase MepM/ murein hydrolase activator NlpD